MGPGKAEGPGDRASREEGAGLRGPCLGSRDVSLPICLDKHLDDRRSPFGPSGRGHLGWPLDAPLCGQELGGQRAKGRGPGSGLGSCLSLGPRLCGPAPRHPGGPAHPLPSRYPVPLRRELPLCGSKRTLLPPAPRVGGGRLVSLLSLPGPGPCCPQHPAATALDPAALFSLRGAPWPPPPPGPAGPSAPIPWGAHGPLPTPGSE